MVSSLTDIGYDMTWHIYDTTMDPMKVTIVDSDVKIPMSKKRWQKDYFIVKLDSVTVEACSAGLRAVHLSLSTEFNSFFILCPNVVQYGPTSMASLRTWRPVS